jgi:hypothetical protein
VARLLLHCPAAVGFAAAGRQAQQVPQLLAAPAALAHALAAAGLPASAAVLHRLSSSAAAAAGGALILAAAAAAAASAVAVETRGVE